MTRRGEDWFDDADVTRLHIFVPAVMGAGLVLSLYTLARDALHARHRRAAGRRVVLTAHATARHVLTGRPADTALLDGLRPRVAYLLTAVTTGAVAVYAGVGSTMNYLNPVGYVRHIAWVLMVSLGAATLFAAVAVTSAVAFVSWPRIPAWQRPLLAGSPLGQRPVAPDGGSASPPLLLGWAAGATAAAAAMVVLIVARAPYVFGAADAWFDDAAPGWTAVERLAPLDVLGRTDLAVLLVLVIGLATLRCVPFALAYLAGVSGGLLLDQLVKSVVSRPRPAGGALAHWTDSFPSGHLLQATLITGLLPLALLVLFRRRWLAVGALALLSVTLVGGTALRLHRGVHWWSDAVGGVLIGAAIVLTAWWALAHGRLHRRCDRCPWRDRRGVRLPGGTVVPLSVRTRVAARQVSRAWVLAVVIGFAALALTVGLPRNPAGDGLVSQLERPVQLGMVVLAALAWAASWRWAMPAAVLLVLAGNVLAVFSSFAYQPLVGVLVVTAFLVPAAGLWLAWQHGRPARAVVAVAVTTAVLVAATWAGGSAAYARFSGPAHPESPARALPVDRVVFMWSGGVTTSAATVVAGLAAGHRTARLVLRPNGSADDAVRGPVVAATGTDRVVRLPVDGLRPGTAYRYVVEVDGQPDRSRGAGELRTMPVGAASFTVVAASCARTASNGAVFDAIGAVRPLLYLQTGDLHYGNPAVPDPGLFGALYRRVLSAPAQAALYRSVPVAYVWDDHDYGPNDADSTAPTREVARAAYRRYVPHGPLPAGDGAIYQAFTVGRVRFVLTDTRSGRTSTSMLGARQLAWLERELVESARTHALVVWVNPDPWISPAMPGADDWGGYPDERARIASVLAAAAVGNLVMISGDAHMVAVDDGSHSGYAPGVPGFPVLQAAALDRPGNVKGGPYSGGAFPGAGQFGTLTVTDTGGSTVDVELAGRTWRGTVPVLYRTTVAVPPTVA